MSTLQVTLLTAHTLIALAIIALVLLQRGKGADAGAAFGAGASGTVFGSRGSASFFSRMTAVLATVFFLSSLGLAYMSSQRPIEVESLLDEAPPVETEPASLPAAGEASTGDEEMLPAAGEAAGQETGVEGTDLPALDSADEPESGGEQ